MVERRKRPTSASQYCVRGTDSLLYQREHSATRWDGALELGVNYMGKPTTAPFTFASLTRASKAFMSFLAGASLWTPPPSGS